MNEATLKPVFCAFIINNATIMKLVNNINRLLI